MFICIIDTDGDHAEAIEHALRGLFDLGPLEPLPVGATYGAAGAPEAQSYSQAPTDADRRRVEAEMWAASEARQANPRIGQTVDPMAGIDPTDQLISPATSLGYTTDGQALIPLDLGNGQIVYVPQSAIPDPVEPLAPFEQYPTAPAEPNMPPYLVAQPYITDPTDNLIPEYGHDQFQQFTPQVPQVYQNMPQEPSVDELNVWAAQQRAEAAARFQAQQAAEMAARGITNANPAPDFTGFPQTPEVNYARPTPNL